MNIRISTTILLILLIVLSGIATYFILPGGISQRPNDISKKDNKEIPQNNNNNENDLEKNPEKIFIKHTTSIQGMSQSTYIFKDRSFQVINQSPIQCQTGKLSAGEFISLVDLIKQKNLLDLEIAQGNDPGLECEGSVRLQINYRGESNNLSPPCVAEYSKQAEDARKTIQETREELENVTASTKEPCEKGVYVKAVKIMGGIDCPSVDEIFSSQLIQLVKESARKGGAYEFLKQPSVEILSNGGTVTVKEPFKELSYMGREYQVDNSCHYIDLEYFNGVKFKKFKK